jgi:outer membrane biosynthesis protein TonB
LVIEPQYWHPLFVSSRKHPQNATQEEVWKRAFGRRLILCGRRSGPRNNPNKTTQPQTSIEHRPAATETKRTEEPPEQPATQAEVPAMNTSMPSTQPPPQHQETKAQEDQQQDSKEEIEAIIEDELVHLRQENERLRLMQELLARRKAMVKRDQVMQQ